MGGYGKGSIETRTLALKGIVATVKITIQRE